MATKKSKVKKAKKDDYLVHVEMPSGATFGVGFSPLTSKVHAGRIKNGVEFVGKKHDVTFSFVDAVLAWLEADDGERRVYAGEYVYIVTLKKKKHHTRPAKVRSK